jgi:hypothetical protein
MSIGKTGVSEMLALINPVDCRLSPPRLVSWLLGGWSCDNDKEVTHSGRKLLLVVCTPYQDFILLFGTFIHLGLFIDFVTV